MLKGKGKVITTVEKHKKRKSSIEGMSTLEISKNLCWDHQLIKNLLKI